MTKRPQRPLDVRAVRLGRLTLGGPGPFFLIAGPCVIESPRHTLHLAERLRDLAAASGLPFIFKASFDKANRSQLSSYRGPGLERGLEILAAVKERFKVPILTDVHEASQVQRVASVADVLQIPAFLCRQTDLVVESARSGRIVNIKKGQFMAPWDMGGIITKAASTGNRRLILTERGSSFGYNNLVVDFRALPIMRSLGYPVVFDLTHSVQRPGALGDRSGGDPQFIETLGRAGIAAGVDGIFMEVHDHPERALSDGANAFRLRNLDRFLRELAAIRRSLGMPRRSAPVTG
jgi:2-dehydro-3-deoxyphosphooctonate aldolase (KDO 8-P synthase)